MNCPLHHIQSGTLGYPLCKSDSNSNLSLSEVRRPFVGIYLSPRPYFRLHHLVCLPLEMARPTWYSKSRTYVLRKMFFIEYEVWLHIKKEKIVHYYALRILEGSMPSALEGLLVIFKEGPMLALEWSPTMHLMNPKPSSLISPIWIMVVRLGVSTSAIQANLLMTCVITSTPLFTMLVGLSSEESTCRDLTFASGKWTKIIYLHLLKPAMKATFCIFIEVSTPSVLAWMPLYW